MMYRFWPLNFGGVCRACRAVQTHLECDVTRGPRLDTPWPSHIKYTTRVGITICIVIRLQESVVACILQPWSGGKDPDRYNGIIQWYDVTDTLMMMSSQWRTIQCSKPSGTTQVTTGYPWAPGVLRLGYCDVTRGPRLDTPWPSHIKYTTMVGITICIVIRLQESVVACILQPWSGGKDPDRYIEGATSGGLFATDRGQDLSGSRAGPSGD
jgi:hypothetical protein